MDFLCSLLAGQVADLQATATLMQLPAAIQHVGSTATAVLRLFPLLSA